MKIYIALLVACLVAAALAQGQNAAQAAAAQAAIAQAAAAAGGAAGAASASAGRESLFAANPLMQMAAFSGQLGDGFQSMTMCNMMGIPPMLCFGMQM